MLQNALLFSFAFFFFIFHLFLSKIFTILAVSQYYENIYRPSFLFIFFQLYSHIISLWLLLKLCVPEVEHDEKHFFWKKKSKTIICCLNSLCRALLESTILWISETIKKYFHYLFLIEKLCFIHFWIPQAIYDF